MKTLVINGTTRRNGDTEALIREMVRALHGDVKIVTPFFEGISPCIDCRFCWKHPGCAVKDGMQEVYAYLEDCDNVVLASPVWFSELSGPTLNFASRLQTFFAAAHFRGEQPKLSHKRSAVLLAGGEKGTEKKALTTAHTLLKLMNALPVTATVLSMDTDVTPAARDGAALERVRAAAVLLAEESTLSGL